MLHYSLKSNNVQQVERAVLAFHLTCMGEWRAYKVISVGEVAHKHHRLKVHRAHI